jgi:nucleoside-diphosphate-sugar epimerase
VHVAVAGAHGQIARRLTRLLSARGDTVIGLVRNPDHVAHVRSDAAGAGPGSGVARKDTVDRAAAVLLADAAERAGVATYLLVSSMGVEQVAGGATPEGVDEVFVAYLRAKLAAEEDLLGRSGLGTTVLRPGRLTDDPGTGLVTLAPRTGYGAVPRDDVAAVLVALLDRPAPATVLELVSGATPVADAVAAVSPGAPG